MGHAKIGIYSGRRFSRPHPKRHNVKLLELPATARDQKRLAWKGRGPGTSHRDKSLKRFIVIFGLATRSQPTLSRRPFRPQPASGRFPLRRTGVENTFLTMSPAGDGADRGQPNFRSFGCARAFFQGLKATGWHYIVRVVGGMRSCSGRRRPRRSSKTAWARSGRTTQRNRSSRPGSAAVGRMTSVLVMAASSWRRVRGLLPRPARLCHCSSVFHST